VAGPVAGQQNAERDHDSTPWPVSRCAPPYEDAFATVTVPV